MTRHLAPWATTKEQTIATALDVVDAATLKATPVTFGIVGVTGQLNRAIQNATASKTQTLVGGTTITADVVILTSASDYDAVTLPTVSTVTYHEVKFISPSTNKKTTIWPGEATTSLDGGAAGASVTLTGGYESTLLQTSATSWISHGTASITGAT